LLYGVWCCVVQRFNAIRLLHNRHTKQYRTGACGVLGMLIYNYVQRVLSACL